ncbi:MAG: oligoendopeptidase F [Clostridiaceae bacterium]|nr:oligoendopeptidase F [Clostridiaceae bacterium]
MEKQPKSRTDIEAAYRWRLEDIFASDAAWEEALRQIQPLLDQVAGHKGRLAESAGRLLAAMRDASRLDMDLMELFAYARMRRDEDNGNSLYQDMTDRVTGLYYQSAATTAFLSPEIAAIPEETLRAFLDAEAGLEPYRHQLVNLLRTKPHILPEEQEALLSRFGPVAEGIGHTYTMLDNVDIKLGSIADGQGGTIELTPAVFGRLREHRDRTVRADAFARVHQAFADVGRTLATLYATRIKADLLFALARRHENSLSTALFEDNLPVSLYSGLIDAVHNGQETLNRYLALRKRRLGYQDLHIYDTYLPLLDVPAKNYTFEEACAIIRRGLAPLGPDYLEALEHHLTGRWIDVCETPGKTNGAYSWGTYKTHPYILLNFSGSLSDLFTLAHELGHSLHTWFSNKRPYPQSHYPIFLAEIASTVNEILMMRTLLKACDTRTAEGRHEKAYLLNHFLEEFRLTVFRQTMFAEFEWQAHRRAEQGEALTAEILCGLYLDLLRQYFGPDLVIDDFMKWEWTRIPHFYNAYYVFQYATGFSAAVALTRQILAEGEPAVTRYLAFLGSGSSDYPLRLLQSAGVDLSGPGPVRDAMLEFADRLDELSGLLEEA